jgi:ATP-dependent Clp protease adaptor protein ClpS
MRTPCRFRLEAAPRAWKIAPHEDFLTVEQEALFFSDGKHARKTRRENYICLGGDGMSEHHPDFQEDLENKVEDELEEPPLYKVLLHNDDYTTMEFVVEILQRVFHKSPPEALRVMLLVHKDGVGVCGLFPAEIAETKVELVHHLAKKHGYPLKCSMEEA